MRTLLIVDDEPDLLSLLAEEVSSWGIDVKTASDIKLASDILATQGFTAVLSDISMPGGTGLQLLAQIRAKGSNIPFLFLTAYDSKEYMIQALKLGASDFLQKPYDRDELKNSVMKILEIGVRQIENDRDLKSGVVSDRNQRNQKIINLLKVQNSRIPNKKSS